MPVIHETVKIYDEQEVKGNKIRIHIAIWGNGAPVLEKREFWIDDHDQERAGRVKGLNARDMDLILENIDEIKKLLVKK